MLKNESLLERFKSVNLKSLFTKDEFTDINNILQENKEMLENKDSELKSKILELMERDKKK
jgi:ribosomal protein S8